MGLAATQARFLGITARKANCEFQSMELAQQKLSITRDLEKATQQYQNSINASKLVWDPDGTGDNVFDLSYDIMMRPSAVNNYSPFLISTRDGRIVLNSRMAAAARAIGLPQDGCEPTSDMYRQFINQLVKHGGMSEVAATTVRKAGLLENVGLGAPLLDKTTASTMSYNDLLAYINILIENGKGGNPAQKETADKLTFEYGVKDKDGKPEQTIDFKTSLGDKGDANSNYFLINGTKMPGDKTNFTLTDLLTGDITYARTGAKNPSGWKKFLSAVCSIASGGLANLITGKGLTSLFGSKGSLNEKDFTSEDLALVEFINDLGKSYLEILDIDLEDELQVRAFEYAMQETIALLTNVRDLGSRNHSKDAFKDATTEANNFNGWVKKNANKGSNYGTTAVSLSNLAESMLTFYAQAMNGYDDKYHIQAPSKNSSYVTDDPTYLYDVKNPDATTAEEMYIAEFYSAMFNNICHNGWTENNSVDDKEYLSNSLKNAQFFVTSMGTDLYYYQDRYMSNMYIKEVTDDDAIKEAEIAYTQAKSKLNYKEERIEVKMKKLDLEISSLSTEYDTVKGLINKNVEKAYTLFNS